MPPPQFRCQMPSDRKIQGIVVLFLQSVNILVSFSRGRALRKSVSLRRGYCPGIANVNWDMFDDEPQNPYT